MPSEIDELARVFDPTAEADRLDRVLSVIAARVLLDRARDAEEDVPVRHARDLDTDHAGVRNALKTFQRGHAPRTVRSECPRR